MFSGVLVQRRRIGTLNVSLWGQDAKGFGCLLGIAKHSVSGWVQRDAIPAMS